MATKTQHDTTNNISHSENTSILDRSLTEMLVSAFEDERRPNDDAVSDIESSLAEQVVMLESQLITVTMRLDREREEKTSMHNQLELLPSELELYKKGSDKQKQQIRKLTSENDGYNGMRRFAETGTQDELMDELQSTKAKLLSLKEHVIDVTSRMIGALEEAPDTAAINDAAADTPFTLVVNSKRGRQLLRQQNARARQTVPQSLPRQTGIPAPTQGQPIPVVWDDRPS